MSKIFTLPQAGIEVEIGKYANQADGAAWIKAGNTILLATAVATKEAKDFMGFFPLTVEYREKTSAAGRIPGGFIKREGRLSDNEVLISRLTDRSIRPFFPSSYFNEVQILSTVYSSDGGFPTSVLSILGSSLALTISSIPFEESIGAVQVSRINGEWVFNAKHEDTLTADAHILIAGSRSGICMVEGNGNELSEETMLEIFEKAHQLILEQIDWQAEIAKSVGKEKEYPESNLDWQAWEQKVSTYFDSLDIKALVAGITKKDRSTAIREARTIYKAHFNEMVESGEIDSSILSYLFDSELKRRLPGVLMEQKVRVDKRDFTQVRKITTEVGILPQTHGSSVFHRGETQALASVTLGTGQDAQKVETLIDGVQERSFMLHYNFPPFSVGEVRPIRGVGRREIGHGYLAENSFKYMLPDQTNFPYTIRSLVDILECNGSSSMATVCATTMALMDAGVPIKKMVAGIAMGLLQNEKGEFQVLTDILGEEDALGLMDFKVTGTETGICAIQMDIKAKEGLPRQVMQQALRQAYEARIHILNEMSTVLKEPRPTISPLAPKVVSFSVNPDMIGAIIGPSGKVIKEIIAKTDTEIDISDDGTVRIYAKDHKAGMKAEQWVRVLGGDIKEGSIFNGTVRRLTEFGIFVELVPGKDGLVHISKVARDKQPTLAQICKVEDRLKVKVVSYDKDTGRVQLIAPALQ